MSNYDTGWDPDNSGYTFKSWEEYHKFEIPFRELKHGDRIAIKGSTFIWTVTNDNLESVFKICGKITAMSSITVRTENGFYGGVERANIERKLESEMDERVHQNGGQLLLF
jgi:hypothetical protein